MTTFGKKTSASAPAAGKPAFGRKGSTLPGRAAAPKSEALSPQAQAFLQAERERAASLPKPANDRSFSRPVKAPNATLPGYAAPANDTHDFPGKPVWGRRVLARLVDEFGVWFLILMVFYNDLSTALGVYISEPTGSAAENAAGVTLFGYAVIFMVLQSAYNIIMEASPKQATLGKMMVGAVVTVRDGSRPGLGKIVMRNTVGRFVANVMPFYSGYVMGLFNKEKRCIHDMMSGTVVRKRVPGGAAAGYGEVFA